MCRTPRGTVPDRFLQNIAQELEWISVSKEISLCVGENALFQRCHPGDTYSRGHRIAPVRSLKLLLMSASYPGDYPSACLISGPDLLPYLRSLTWIKLAEKASTESASSSDLYESTLL